MNATVQSKPKLPSLLSLILVTALGVSLAKLMWLVLTPERKLDISILESNDIENIQKEKINFGKVIANQHLFGVIKKAPVVVKKEPEKVAERVVAPTKLNLELHGIVAYKSKKGFALISSNNGPQKVFGKGDVLEEGVTVSNIYPEKVMIDNHGKIEELILPVNQVRKSNKRRNKRVPASAFGGAPLPKVMKKPPIRKQAQRNAPDLSKFRQAVLTNPRKLMDIATPSPAIVDGQFIGFRVQPGSERKFFRKLGFRPNDIITEVNGIILDDASKGAMVLGELSQAAELSITVKRGSQEIHIQHSF